MEIYRHDISDVLQGLSDLVEYDFDDQPDLFVCTLGFEDRTHRIIAQLSEKGLLAKTKLLLVHYPTNVEDNAASLPIFEAAAEKMAAKYDILYQRNDYGQNLTDKLHNITDHSGAKIVFDISTCSSYVFYPTMKELLSLDAHLSIVYSEADTYYPKLDEWMEVANKADAEDTLFVEAFEGADFQSIGVDDVYSCPLYSEMNPGNRASTLVAVPNFSAMRMNAIRTRDQEMSKTKHEDIKWLVAKPPAKKNEWRVEAVKKTNRLESVDSSNIIPVSTLQYKDMLGELESIWLETRYKFCMSIGSLGSKMQHVGTFFFLYLHKDVGLWLAEPREFQAQRFSSGVGNAWTIRFGPTNELRQSLARYMTYRWEL